MKLEFFISFPVRFDADSFRDSLPTLYEVLGLAKRSYRIKTRAVE